IAWTSCDGLFTPSALGPLQDVADQWGGAVRLACADGVPRDARFAALLAMLRDHDGLSVLVVEDLHFADEATLDLVRHVARRLRAVRAIVVATYRAGGGAGPSWGPPPATTASPTTAPCARAWATSRPSAPAGASTCRPCPPPP